MKIPLNLLSTSLRKEWLEVPSQPTDRSAGIGRVKVQEIAGDAFDDLWGVLAMTERAATDAANAAPLDPKKLREARRASFEARKAVLEACVIDHDPSTFASEVPKCDPESRQGQELIAQLLELGYSLEESQKACVEGLAKKPFSKRECAAFYERCQPDNEFADTLLVFIKRFHQCETLTSEKYWTSRGAPPLVVKVNGAEVVPLVPPKEPPK